MDLKKFFTIFLGIIMASSILGMWAFQPRNRYNGVDLIEKDGRWYVRTDKGVELGFDFHPEQLESIELNKTILELFNTAMVYVTFDSIEGWQEAIDIARFDISNVLQLIGIYAEQGTTEQNDFGFQILTCSNATRYVPVILLTKGNSTISLKGRCIELRAREPYELLALKDRLLYALIGVME